MIRCSCHGLQGCVPVAARATPRGSASARSCCRRSPRSAVASANESQRPVRISISDAISSPTRCGSSSVPRAASWSSSKRLTRPSVSGSISANSSSTATVKSGTASNAARDCANISSYPSRCSSPTSKAYLGDRGVDQASAKASTTKSVQSLADLPRVWAGTYLPGYHDWGDALAFPPTYARFPLDWLPPIERELDDELRWLLREPPVDESLEGTATRADLDALLAGEAVVLPPSFAAFIDSEEARKRLRSATDCYLRLPDSIARFGEGRLINFLADSQACAFWLLYTGRPWS